VTVAEPKTSKPGKAKSITASAEGEDEESDQLVGEDIPLPTSPVSADAATGEEKEELPEIEGDVPADEASKFEAQLITFRLTMGNRHG
jgi:hypothetical protein